MQFDDFIKKTGEFGPYQRRIFFSASFVTVLSAFQGLNYVFVAARPDYWCRLPVLANFSDNVSETFETWRRPMVADYGENPLSEDDRCFKTKRPWRPESSSLNANEGLIPCDDWIFDKSQYTSTIVTEYRLVCDQKWKRSMSQSAFMIGRLLGSTFLGILADTFGRRKMMLVNIFFTVLLATAAAFAPEFYSYTALRFLLAIFLNGVSLTTFIIVMEIVGPSWRSFAGNVYCLYWATGYSLLAGVAYLVRNHVHLQLCCSLPFVALGVYYWIIPESPRWLLAKGRTSEAHKVVKAIMRANCPDISEREMERTLESFRQQESDVLDSKKDMQNTAIDENNLFLRVIREWYFWKWTSILSFLWLVCGLVYYSLSLNSSDLAGNDYLNFFLTGVVEIPGYLLSILMLRYMGRQWSTFSSAVATGAALLLTIYLPNQHLALTVALTVFGKLAITITFAVVFIYTSEFYPTVIRTLSMGICSTLARLGGALAPFASDVGDVYKNLPSTVFAILTIAGGLLVFLLPETKGKLLPQNIDDGRRMNDEYSCLKRLTCRDGNGTRRSSYHEVEVVKQ